MSKYDIFFKHKFTFFLQTVPDSQLLTSDGRNIKITFYTSYDKSHICSDAERALLALPVKLGGSGFAN